MTSSFKISEINPNENGKEGIFNAYVSVKRMDAKWKDFPAAVLPNDTVKHLERIKSFKIYKDDVLLCGYPRSGTTLMQEMIWLIVHDFDFEGAKKEITDKRFPMLE